MKAGRFTQVTAVACLALLAAIGIASASWRLPLLPIAGLATSAAASVGVLLLKVFDLD